MEKLIYPRFILAVDNFYGDPELVYRKAKEANYYKPEDYTGFRSRTVYHETGVKKKLERLLGIRITRWDTDPEQENGVFYLASARGKDKELPGVHSDTPYNDITAVIYLTPGLPFDCGTSLWMHKQTRIINPPTPADAKRLSRKLSDLRQQFEDEAEDRSKWVEIDRMGYRPNRMVAYPSGVLHSATRHYGGSLVDTRIYQTFRIGVDWRTFPMTQSR